jgi:DNA-directed RNA polymerase subunit RPC12/RpoP
MLDFNFDNETGLKKIKNQECPICGGKIKKLKDFYDKDFFDADIVWKTVYKCINCKHQFHLFK